MFIEYIRKERLAKRQWDNGAAGISICQFTLPAPAEKIYLSFPTYDSKFALEVLFCLDGQMTAYRTNALPHDIEKDHILILSNTYGPYSLQVHTGFRGVLASLNINQMQASTYAALGIDLNPARLRSKLEPQHGLALLSNRDWVKGVFDCMAHLPERIGGQCCFLTVLQFLLLFDAQNGAMENTAAPQDPAYGNRSVLAAQAYMKDHLSEKITIADLCRIVSLSPTYLKVEFHRTCGKSIHRWFVELRMQRAVELIRCTELPIYKIAQEVGYESMSQFSAAFRKQYGATPGEFKKMSKTETGLSVSIVT
ncbi:MAG: helix-turn-helix transcriptional regulator [Clostridiales bacterium]|nr:helix-turn-helix transcriptional regulator [Clostridiales bacterium]